MNYSAHEHWTDGQRIHSLAPTDGGLRQCECSAYFLQRNAIEIPRISFEENQETLATHDLRAQPHSHPKSNVRHNLPEISEVCDEQ